MIKTSDKVKVIQRSFRRERRPSTDAHLARLLRVSPSSVLRWKQGKTEPRGETAKSLDILYRTVVKAEQGDRDAKKILGAFLGVTGAMFLGLGLGGALLAAGLGWLIGSEDEPRR